MATSGTVGRTQFDITNFIETAVRRSGKVSGTISAEQQQIGRNALFLLMSHLANRGISLWCIKKYIIPIIAYQSVYTLPVGIVDLLKTLYRTSTLITSTPTTSAGAIVLDYGAAPASPINNLTLLECTDSAFSLAVSESDDTVTWDRLHLIDSVLPTAQVYSFDLDRLATKRYLRVSMVGADPLCFSSVESRGNPTEFPVVKLNRDIFADLPNKYQTAPAGPQLQIWFDKQRDAPQITPWPLVTTSGDQFVLYTQRQMEDPGDLTDSLDVPQRWYQAIAYQLAHDVALEIPGVDSTRIDYLNNKSMQLRAEAEDGETDGAPIRFVPRIGGYTR